VAITQGFPVLGSYNHLRMTAQPFTRSDRRLAMTVAALSAVCAAYVWLNYAKAFPEASIDLQLSRAEITRRAASFLKARGWSAAGFRQITVFDPDDDARLYLERELGLDSANRLMSGAVSVWRWRARWFRPPQKEEYVVYLSPAGRLVGFDHVIPEDAPGVRLSQEAARELAQRFVAAQTSAGLRLVEERLEQRPRRYDYVFTWEQEGFRAKTATYRRTVQIYGDSVGSYREFLYIPEAWRRDFAALRSRNELYAGLAGACWIPLALAAVALGIQALRQRLVPWRPLLFIASVVGGLMVVNQVNSLPFLVDSFPTSSPYSQTVALLLLQAIGAGMGAFFYVVIAAVAGEPLYRNLRPAGLSLRDAIRPSRLGSREFFRASLAGYGLAAAHMAYLVAFYLIGRRFGVWSPQDVNYSDMLSTPLPWIYPIAIAALASSSEEFWFRLLAIPLLRKFLKVTWIAVLIPAFVWGFLHANYPQEPPWIRGVEVGVIGVAAGFVMLRFGIAATLIWHFVVDAVLIGLFLFEAQSWYFRVSGWILGVVVLSPLLASLLLYRRYGGFVVEEEAAPAAPEPRPAPPPVEPQPAVPIAPAWPAWRLYAAAAAVAAAGVALDPSVFGDWIRVRVTAAEAQAIARGRVPNASSWRTSSNFLPNLNVPEFEYIRRIGGAGAAQKAVREHTDTALWRVRFFRPQTKEEWVVFVNQEGRVVRTDHVLDEQAPGANLSPEQARQAAERALPNGGLVLVDSNQQKRERRTDYSFTFEDPAFKIGAARARVSVEVHGDEPSNLRRFIKLPEAWLRDFESPNVRAFVAPALAGAAILPLLILFIRRIARPDTVLHWRAYALAAVIAWIVTAISAFNGSTTMMSGYNTAMPEQNYVTQYLLVAAIVTVLLAAGLFAAVMAADVFRQAAVGRAPLNAPSLARSVAVAALVLGLANLLGWLVDLGPGPRTSLRLWGVAGLDAWAPGWRAVASGYVQGVAAMCLAAVAVFVALRFFGPRQRWTLVGMAIALLSFARSMTALQFLVHAAAWGAVIATVALIVKTCADDLIGLGVAAFWIAGLPLAFAFSRQPSPWIRWNGVAAMAVLAGAGIAAIFVFRAWKAPVPAPEAVTPPVEP
jgi:hypothetical protein